MNKFFAQKHNTLIQTGLADKDPSGHGVRSTDREATMSSTISKVTRFNQGMIPVLTDIICSISR